MKSPGLVFMESSFPIEPKYIFISLPLSSCFFLHLSISSRLNSSTMLACPCVCVTCAILVCFFVSVFLISSCLHLCLCHVCSILPVLTFLPAQWKEDDGRARQDYLGEEKLPSCPLFWGVRSPRMGMWSQILGSGEVSGKTPGILL